MASPIIEIIGVYDADSTLLGEVSYWIGARLGKTHCSLCELTHGLFTVKSEWKSCERALSVPFTTYHRNDAPADVLTCAAGQFPVVLARMNQELSMLLNREQLEAFNGDTERFGHWLNNYIAAR
ncbi:MAG: hypothetical protein ACK45J_01670 [Acidimicrobiaceae bacterium]|jgi:hypothetical protein|nr:hypothetical protein [Ilumatobacteraceae bacterium]